MAEEKKLPLYSLGIEDMSFDSINVMSLVEYPAMESDFLAFSKSVKLQKLNEGVVTGVALRPDKEIYRNEPWGEFNVIFTKDSVRKIAKSFFKNHNHDNTTIEHSFNVNNLYIFESWLVTNPAMDKATELGIDVQEGDWVISMDISGNKEVMSMVEGGDVRGFSLEGFFSRMLIENSKFNQDVSVDEVYDKIEEIIKDSSKSEEEKYDEIENFLNKKQ